jgi:uncharacterized membrane protein YczE
MNETINKLKNKSYENFFIKVLIAIIGVALVGIALAFNSSAMLGNDPVAVFYDGIRNLCGLPREELGLVTNLINCVFVVTMFMLGRKYINIGTFVYAVPMGSFIDLGFKIHSILNIPSTLNWRIFTAFCGCSMLFLGVGIFIAVDIGMDPCTGIVVILRDKIKSQYKTSKIVCDICMLTLGFTFGGKIGAVTVISALIAGPTIQKVSEIFDKRVLKFIKLNKLTVSNS